MISSRLARIGLQGRRFVRTFTWLISDSVKSTPILWRNMLLAAAMTLASNAGIVLVIFSYIRFVDSNRPISLAGLSIIPRESFLLLGLAVTAMIVVSLIFALSQYAARSNAISAMGAFEKRCTVRALQLVRLLPDPRAEIAQSLLRHRKLFHLVKMDATHCGMAVKFLGFGLQSLLMLIFAVVVMFVLDPRTTALVCGVGIIIIAAQYPSNLFAATSAVVHDRTRPEMQNRLTALLARASRQPRWSANSLVDTDIVSFFDQRAPLQHIASSENKFRAIEISGLTTRIGGALILGGMILSFGASVIRGDVDWAALTAYLALLRSALTSITAVFQTVTMVSRMYPQIQEFSEFVLSASKAEVAQEASESRVGRNRFILQALNEQGESDELTIAPGTLVALCVAPGYGREVATDLHWCLRAHCKDGDDSIPVTIDLALPAPARGDRNTIEKWKNDVERTDAINNALGNLADAGTDIILIDRNAVDLLAPDNWEWWKEILNERLVVIVYTDPQSPVADIGEPLILFYQRAGELGWRNNVREAWPLEQNALLFSGGRTVAPNAADGEDAGLFE